MMTDLYGYGREKGIHHLMSPLFCYHSHWIKNEKNQDELFDNFYNLAFVFEDIRSLHFFKKYLLIVYYEHDHFWTKTMIKYCFQWFQCIPQLERYKSDENGNFPYPENHHYKDWILDMLEREIESHKDIIEKITYWEHQKSIIEQWIDKLKQFRLFAEKTGLLVPNTIPLKEFEIQLDVDST